MNYVLLLGRMVADPEIKQTQTGLSVCSFRLAVDRQGKDKGADFITCTAWRNTADFISKYFHKGTPIVITGSIQTRQYEDKTGNKRTATEVLVNSAEFVPKVKDEQTAPTQTAPASNEYAPVDENEDLPF